MRRRGLRSQVSILLLASLMLTCAANGATHAVVIEQMKFTPGNLEIKSGDTVVWTNKDFFPHTVTHQGKPGFDSKEIPAQKSWKHKFKQKGLFPYVCTLHPTMKASVEVK